MSDNDQYIDETAPSDRNLKRIAVLGQEFIDWRAQVNQLTFALENATKQMNQIGTDLLPAAMKEVGLRSFTMSNGIKLETKPVLGCSLPKGNIDKAEKWLDENGHSGMVKFMCDVELPKGTKPLEIKALENFLLSYQFKYEMGKRIHPQTLLKWAREMEENNDVIPPDIFSVYHGFKTEVK